MRMIFGMPFLSLSRLLVLVGNALILNRMFQGTTSWGLVIFLDVLAIIPLAVLVEWLESMYKVMGKEDLQIQIGYTKWLEMDQIVHYLRTHGGDEYLLEQIRSGKHRVPR